jgi:hypothetical protein
VIRRRGPDAPTGPVGAYRWVLLAGLLASLAVNLPGHLSYDSVVQLYEGRFHVRVTWAPAVLSWILGVFDSVVPGTGLYVTASSALLFGSLASLPALRARGTWLAVVLAGAASLSPLLLIYQGIVWKDVLFANLSVAGFVLIAHAVCGWDRLGRRIALLALSALALAFAVLVRQNGAISALLAALSLGAAISPLTGGRKGLAWAAGALAVVLALSQAIGAVAQPAPASDSGAGKGLRVLQRYDIVGAASHDPASLGVIRRADPGAADMVLRQAVPLYSAERVDTLSQAADIGPRLKALPGNTIEDQWRDLLTSHTGPYLTHRADAFRWLMAPPQPMRCLPLHVGVEGRADMLDRLGIAAGQDRADQRLARYGYRFVGTPVLSHVAYALIAAAVAVLLLVRRDPADIVMIGLMLAALGFAASFFLISIACDYRYLYFLDIAAITGVLYVALDPGLGRKKAYPR